MLTETVGAPHLVEKLVDRQRCNLDRLSNVLQFCAQCLDAELGEPDLKLLIAIQDEEQPLQGEGGEKLAEAAVDQGNVLCA